MGGNLVGGSGGGRAPRRGPADRVHSWSQQGRSHGRDRRSQGRPDGNRRGLEQMQPGQVKSSHLYLYSAFNNTNCNKALHNIKIGKLCQ